MLKSKELGSLVEQLNQKRKEPVSFSEVLALAELSAQSLQAFFETMDTTVYREMREIAGFIERMKGEIGALQADEIKKSRLPAAGQELGAIVQATENATNTIMESAEALMAADPSDIAAYQALVQEKVILIFEACSFQDITGQRIAKVCETLQLIETRVGRFASVICSPQPAALADNAERARQERKKRLMLNGPQLAGDGIDQSAVDDLFASATVAERKAAAGAA